MNRQGGVAPRHARRLLAPWSAVAAIAAVLAFPHTTSALPPRTPSVGTTSYERLFAQLNAIQPDSSRVAEVRHVTLRRDVATIEFEQGQMTLLRPIQGRVWGSVFTGRGTFAFRPPTEIERDQLKRFYRTDSLVTRFTTLVLFFADTTLVDLASRAKFRAGEISKEARLAVRKSLDLILDSKSRDVNYSIGKTCFEGASNELFLAFVGQKDASKGFIFQIDPFQAEQVQLWRPVKATFFQGRIRNREIISQFPLEATREHGPASQGDYVASYDDTHYRIRARFDGGLRMVGEEEVRLRSLEEGQNWLALALAPELDVDSVRWDSGESADFFKGPDALLLWVRSDHPLTRGEERTLTIRYHGDVVQREDDWVYFDPGDFWYPRLVPGRRATYELEYEYPSQYTLASVGDPSPIERRGSFTVSRWSIAKPILQASFMIGIYKEHTIQAEKIPPVTILMAESAHRRVRDSAGASLIEQGLAPGKSMDKQVGADIANSLAFFQSLYGPPHLKRFYVAENPLERSALGIAYPGLIHLDWSTFYNTQSEGSDELLRAHEVAHQWWGALGVVPATYHDRWLSEAFAEFSALCYLQMTSADNKRYLDALRRSRERLVKNRRFLLGEGQEAGPIWLGPRTRTSTTPEDYRLVVYEKGAWVLHMLRNLFLELETMKDGGFMSAMREFYETFAEKDATTADFQQVIEKYAGRDMTWFFRQWVHGTGIPRYQFAWRTARTPDGKFKVTCRVDQTNVPDDFQMFMPLHIDLGGDRFAKLRVFVKGKHSEFDLPLLPEEPKAIVFNDLESVLCEVKTVEW